MGSEMCIRDRCKTSTLRYFLQRRLHAATTLSNCVPVLQRSLHAASYVPVQRHCAIALVPRHFSMLSTFHVQLCALISRSLLCSDVTMLQSSSSEVSTCSSSAEIFFRVRPVHTHTIRYPRSTVQRYLYAAPSCASSCGVRDIRYLRSSIYRRSYRNFFAYETVVYLLRSLCHPAFALTSSRALPARTTALPFTSSLCRTRSLHELSVAFRMSPPDIRILHLLPVRMSLPDVRCLRSGRRH